jgi:hypothetical protein
MTAMVGLMSRRLATGDVYPAYSSLRGDPMGVKALAESLARLDGVTVERWHRPRLEAAKAAVFVLGVTPDTLANLSDDSIRELQGVLDAGGRVILSLTSRLPDGGEGEGSVPEGAGGGTGLYRQWRFGIHRSTGEGTTARRVDLPPGKGTPFPWPRDALPETIAWRGPLEFVPNVGTGRAVWSSLYNVHRSENVIDFPVIMERNIGAGSVVLLADSYMLSNEALRKPEDRHTALLVALLGGHTRVIFDEAHLGIVEQSNLATLGRKHGLHWAVACLALLAGLYVWKNMSPLLPPAPASPRPDVTGRSSTDGLVNLLRQAVPASHLLHTCVEEWSKTPAGRPGLDKRLPHVMRIMKDVDEFEDKQRDVVGSYNEIVEAVNGRPQSPVPNPQARRS